MVSAPLMVQVGVGFTFTVLLQMEKQPLLLLTVSTNVKLPDPTGFTRIVWLGPLPVLVPEILPLPLIPQKWLGPSPDGDIVDVNAILEPV